MPNNSPKKTLVYNSKNPFHVLILQNCLQDERFWTSENELENASRFDKEKILSARINLEEGKRPHIINAVEYAVRFNKKPNFEQLKLSSKEKEAAEKYYTEVLKTFEYRIQQVEQSYSKQGIQETAKYVREANEKIDTQIKKFGEADIIKINNQRDAQYQKNNRSVTFDQSQVPIDDKGKNASIVTTPGDNNYQQDRAAVTANVSLLPYWKDRTSELLALTGQLLSANLYHSDIEKETISKTGTTFTLLFIDEDKASVLWGGDSPVFEIDEKSETANLMIYPHHVDDTLIATKAEKERIEKEGGYIHTIPGEKSPRVNGVLIVSRGFGDKAQNGVSDISSIFVKEFSQENKQDITFLIGSDGLDTLSPQEIVQMRRTTKDTAQLAHAYCRTAYNNGSFDNITAIVIPGDCSNTLAVVADGHGGPEKGHKIAEYASQIAPIIFQILALTPKENLTEDYVFRLINADITQLTTELQHKSRNFQVKEEKQEIEFHPEKVQQTKTLVTVSQIEALKQPENSTAKILDIIKKEIEKTNFYSNERLYRSKGNKISIGGKELYKTHTTKKIYEDITAQEKTDVLLQSVANIFKESSKKRFIPFRTKEATTFYRAYSDPKINIFAKETLEEIVKQFSETQWKSKGLGGETVIFNLPDKEKANILNNVPRYAAEIIKLYEKARTYNGWTWEEALYKVENILAKNYQSPDAGLGLRYRETQIAYNKAFDTIQTKFHYKNEPMNKDSRELIDFFKVTTTERSQKNINVENKVNSLIEQTKSLLRDSPFQNEGIETEQAIYLRQYVAYQLFKLSQEISFGTRNKNNLYYNIMLFISALTDIYYLAQPYKETISRVEKFMRSEKNFFAARARLFEDKYPSEAKTFKSEVDHTQKKSLEIQ